MVSQKDPIPSGLLRNYSRFDESANIRTCAPIGKNQPILQVDPHNGNPGNLHTGGIIHTVEPLVTVPHAGHVSGGSRSAAPQHPCQDFTGIAFSLALHPMK